MTAAEALGAAREAGITIVLDGRALLLQAEAEPPASVIEAIARQKEAILKLLQHEGNASGRGRFDGHASEHSIVRWLHEHPCPSQPGSCAWCGGHEMLDTAVLPFGTEPGTHTWLHAECWRPWHTARRDEALRALQVLCR